MKHPRLWMYVCLAVAFLLSAPGLFAADKSFIGVNAPQVNFFSPGSGYLVDAMKSAEPTYARGGYVWGDVMLPSKLTIAFDGGGSVNGGRPGDRIDGTKLLKLNILGDVRNLTLRRQDEPGDTFTLDCYASLKPAGIVRLMDWLKTNDSPVRTWAERCKLTDPLWSGANGGPYEPWLRYAVREGKDLWINVPHQADDDYVLQLARLCKDEIGDAPVNLYIEDTNEAWNWQFGQTKWQSTRGGQKWHADRTIYIARTFRSVFGQTDKRIRPVLGCGIAHPFQRDEALAHLGARTSELYGLAIAPYFGSWLPSNHTGWTAQQYADFALSAAKGLGGPTSNTTKGVRQYKAICDARGLKLLAYECGLDFGQGTANVANKTLAQLHPTTGQAVGIYLDWMRREGIQEACYFNQVSLWNQSGIWGLESLPGQRGPKWKGWADAAARHPRESSVPTAPPVVEPPPPATQPTPPVPPVVGITFAEAFAKKNGPLVIEVKADRVLVKFPLPSPMPDMTFEFGAADAKRVP